VASFLAYLRTIDPLTVRLRLLGEDCPPARKLSHDLLLAVAQGNQAAVQTYLDHLNEHHGGKEHAGQQAHLALDPEQDKEWLLSILTRWHEQVFQSQEAELAAIVARDGAAKRRLARQQPPERLIELATNGLRYEREPDVNRVLLIPTVITRPWILIWQYRDAVIFCHAVADESLSATPAPSPARLVKIYKALADERRLQALQLIATGDHTLQELADRLGIGKSLMHHHVVALRAAGLVRVSIGHERHYEVRAETLAELPEMLRAFLTQQPDPPPPPAPENETDS
jgi:DNA-binding transcriptional ArsR family regulator